MTHRPKDRALIAQTMIDLMKTVRNGRLGPIHSIDTLMVSAAVVVGDAAGKPRNATDIARVIEIPRATVIRKLSGLIRSGLAEKRGTRYHMKADPPDTRYIDEAIEVIQRAADRLSKIG